MYVCSFYLYFGADFDRDHEFDEVLIRGRWPDSQVPDVGGRVGEVAVEAHGGTGVQGAAAECAGIENLN